MKRLSQNRICPDVKLELKSSRNNRPKFTRIVTENRDNHTTQSRISSDILPSPRIKRCNNLIGLTTLFVYLFECLIKSPASQIYMGTIISPLNGFTCKFQDHFPLN